MKLKILKIEKLQLENCVAFQYIKGNIIEIDESITKFFSDDHTVTTTNHSFSSCCFVKYYRSKV